MPKFIFTYIAAHLVDKSIKGSEEHELDDLDHALDLADEINQANGNEYVHSICTDNGERFDVRHLHYFHWRLRMGSRANGNERYVRNWYWAKDICEAADFARALNHFLSEQNPRKWKPWIDYVECKRDGSTIYI